MIHPQVHRSLSQTAIREFLIKKGVNTELLSQETNIDINSDFGYSHLLDHLHDVQEITKSELNGFLIDQLNYGRMKNVYIKFMGKTEVLLDENRFILSIENLLNYFEIEIPKARKSNYTGSLQSSIQQGIRRLLFYEMDKDSAGVPEKITLLIGSCIKDRNSDLCNHYASIELGLGDCQTSCRRSLE